LEFGIAAFLVSMGQGSYFESSDMQSDPEGGGWFDGPRLTAAVVDWLTFRAIIIHADSGSYRLNTGRHKHGRSVTN
jgi:hypothetical protein